MHDPIGEVPKGYVVHRVGDTWLVLDGTLERELISLRLGDPQARAELFASAPVRGRGAAPSVRLSAERSVVLRRYRHGGLLGPVTRALMLGRGRALDELQVCAAAERAGAPVPHVACLVLWPVLGPFWSAILGTLELTGAEQLFEWLHHGRELRARTRVARQVGHAVRRLHDAGVEHGDLQLRNILLGRKGPNQAPEQDRILVVDLDRASFHAAGGVPTSRRAQNLGRLARSAVKTGLWGNIVGPRERAAFASGYLAGDRALRNALRSYIFRERLKLALHRASWSLRSLESRSAPPRPA